VSEPIDPRPATDAETPSSPSPSPPAGRWSGGGGGGSALLHILELLPALVPLAIIVIVLVAMVGTTRGVPFSVLDFLGSSWLVQPPGVAGSSYGVSTFIVGSLVTSLPALLLAMLIALGVAIASVVYLPRIATRFLDPFVDLLAGIPSIVFGLWAFIILRPYFQQSLTPWMAANLGFLPGFAGPVSPTGLGIPITVFILTLMILPISTLLIRDTLRAVPRELWESGLALGATRWEVTRRVSLRYGSRGISSAALLGFSRAIGEAVAVSFLIGGATNFPTNVYSTTNTLSALIIENLDSSFVNPQEFAALAEVGILLTAITLTVNIIARRFVMQLGVHETVV